MLHATFRHRPNVPPQGEAMLATRPTTTCAHMILAMDITLSHAHSSHPRCAQAPWLFVRAGFVPRSAHRPERTDKMQHSAVGHASGTRQRRFDAEVQRCRQRLPHCGVVHTRRRLAARRAEGGDGGPRRMCPLPTPPPPPSPRLGVRLEWQAGGARSDSLGFGRSDSLVFERRAIWEAGPRGRTSEDLCF